MSMIKESSDKEIFAANLKRLMDYYEVKNKDLSAILNLSKSAISNYLSATSIPRTEILARMAEVFGVSIDALICPAEESLSAFKEDPLRKITPYVVPVFGNQLFSVEDIFRSDNFDDYIRISFTPYGDYKCYAIRIHNNNLLSAGISDQSLVLFALNSEVKQKEIAAVLVKSKREILIRRVEIRNKSIILSTDNTKESYTYLETDSDVIVLGKVIYATCFPNS